MDVSALWRCPAMKFGITLIHFLEMKSFRMFFLQLENLYSMSVYVTPGEAGM